MNAPLPLHAAPCAASGSDPLSLLEIFEPEIQLAQWTRPGQAAITRWLDQHAHRLGAGFRQLIRCGDMPDLSGLPAGAGRDALGEDIQHLTELLCDLVDAPMAGVRLEILNSAMCPRLHVDRVGIRLLCTYRGRGTEWVAQSAVDKRYLGAGAGGLPDETSGLLRPGCRIESVPAFVVALLKGSLWQGNHGRGVIHRSPAVDQGPRVVVALDPGWSH